MHKKRFTSKLTMIIVLSALRLANGPITFECMPCPRSEDVCNWLKKSVPFPVEIVKISFTGNGYYYIDGIHYT